MKNEGTPVPLDSEQTKILFRIVSRFLNLRAGTPFAQLRKELGPRRGILDGMVNARSLRVVGGLYLPTFRGVDQLENDIRLLVRANINYVLRALQRLYKRSDQYTFSFNAIVQETTTEDPTRDEKDILPALLLGEEFRYYDFPSGVQPPDDHLIVENVTVHERVLDFVSIENDWQDILTQEEVNRVRMKTLAQTPRGGSVKRMDSLLPLFDRSEFDTDLAELTSTGGAEAPATLIMLDVDKFKTFNDTFLHEAGDKVLKSVAQVLLRVSEQKGGSSYRYGGDELCVLLQNFSVDEGAAVAERIRREVEAVRIEELPGNVTVSVGVACFPESTTDRTQLLNLADKAMYESKHAGGNRVTKAAGRNGKQESVASRLTPAQVQNRIAAVDLELSIQGGTGENFIVIVENKSDETVTVKKIKISHEGVKLAETPPPGPKDDWVLGPRLRRQIEWNARNPDPAIKLIDLLHIYTGSLQAILDVDIQAEVLGALKNCHSRIHVQVEPGSKRIWQL